jgi:hypothetical protein
LEKVEGQKKANPIGFECPDGPNFPKPGWNRKHENYTLFSAVWNEGAIKDIKQT